MEVSPTRPALGRYIKLGKLIAFYDDNGISIDEVDDWFSDDTPARFAVLRLACDT